MRTSVANHPGRRPTSSSSPRLRKASRTPPARRRGAPSQSPEHANGHADREVLEAGHELGPGRVVAGSRAASTRAADRLDPRHRAPPRLKGAGSTAAMVTARRSRPPLDHLMVVDAGDDPARSGHGSRPASSIGTNRMAMVVGVGAPAACHSAAWRRAGRPRASRPAGTDPTSSVPRPASMRAVDPAPSFSVREVPGALVGRRDPVPEVPFRVGCRTCSRPGSARARRRASPEAAPSRSGPRTRGRAATATTSSCRPWMLDVAAAGRDAPSTTGVDAHDRVHGAVSSGTSANPSGASCAIHAAATSLQPTLPTTRSNGAMSARPRDRRGRSR